MTFLFIDMAKLSAAEKQRLYRDADPERRAAYLKKQQQTALKVQSPPLVFQ